MKENTDDCQYCSVGGKFHPTTPKVGDVVDIYITNSKGNKVLEGQARLLERLEEPLHNQPYPLKLCYNCVETINLINQRWKVEFIDKFNKGFVTNRNIPVYYSVGIIHITDEADEEE